MKTVVYPVLDWAKVQNLDSEHIRNYWSEMLLVTGGWYASIQRFSYRDSHRCPKQWLGWIAWTLAVAIESKEEIEALSARKNAEFNVEPLPGFGPMAARSAAKA